MKPSASMPLEPWMTEPEVRAVLAALRAQGGEARFVGGCVRDALLQRPVKDVDIATPLEPKEVMARLGAAGIKAVPTGIDHGTVTAVLGKKHYEITTLRHDVETFGRRARVRYTDDWMEDAARRDFTFNALFCDEEGNLYDPFGGLEDLRQGKTRFVGEAEKRIEEDVLRLLRFFRFHAFYGKGEPDAQALAACAKFALKLPMLSRERIWAEMRRILIAPQPQKILALMLSAGALQQVLPGAEKFSRLERLHTEETLRHIPADSLRALACVMKENHLHNADAVAEGFRLSNRERDVLRVLSAGGDFSFAEQAARRELYRRGKELFREEILLALCGENLTPAQADACFVLADTWPVPVFPLQGADVLAAGIPEGEGVGDLLRTVEAWWIEADFVPDREACLNRLRQVLA